MKYRKFGKLGIECSAFGVGCMRFHMKKNENGESVVDEEQSTPIIRYAIDHGVNYFDTAYVYSERKNEIALGHALRDGYRERVHIATKLPPWTCNSYEDFGRVLDEQLANLETDYIDFYLVHSLNKGSWKKVYDMGICDFLDKAKASGKIKYACFSFHDNYETFIEIMDSYDWDMCQIQYNYLDVDAQATTRGLEYAASKGVPVVIMEGLRGGKLADVPSNVQKLFDEFPVKRTPVQWAFRFLCNHPAVATVLSGVNSMEQLKDNLEIFDMYDVGCMTPEEDALIAAARDAYNSRTKVGCTGCGYCMPCPAGVDIPKVFSLWNRLFMFNDDISGSSAYKKMSEEKQTFESCVGCRACVEICPQKISIPEMLEKADLDMK